MKIHLRATRGVRCNRHAILNGKTWKSLWIRSPHIWKITCRNCLRLEEKLARQKVSAALRRRAQILHQQERLDLSESCNVK